MYTMPLVIAFKSSDQPRSELLGANPVILNTFPWRDTEVVFYKRQSDGRWLIEYPPECPAQAAYDMVCAYVMG